MEHFEKKAKKIILAATALCLASLPSVGRPSPAQAEMLPPHYDFDLNTQDTQTAFFNNNLKGFRNGRFFGESGSQIIFPEGFLVANDTQADFWDFYQSLEDSYQIGAPLSQRWEDPDGSMEQAFEHGTIQLLKNSEGNTSYHYQEEAADSKVIPQEATKPIFFDTIPLPQNVRLVTNWNTVDLYQELADQHQEPVGLLLTDLQKEHIAKTGRFMWLPAIPDASWWMQAAKDTGIEPEKFVMTLFYGEAPFNSPTEQTALTEVNKQRVAAGLLPAQLNKTAVMAERSHVAFVLVNQDLYIKGTPLHQEAVGFLGFTGITSADRLKFFGAFQAAGGENYSPSNNPLEAISRWMDSPPHRIHILESYHQEDTPISFGYANAQLGEIPAAAMVLDPLLKD